MKRTANLGIFQYQPEIDGKEVFSINKALNENWDILDENFYNLSQSIQNNLQSLNDILDNRTSYYIIETFCSGTSWYRKYSDGWIEQGGYNYNTATGNITCTFPVSFANTNYTLAFSIWKSRVSAYYNETLQSYVTHFILGQNDGTWLKWYACGY